MRKKYSLSIKLAASVTIASFLFFAVIGTSSYFLYSNNIVKNANEQIKTSNKQSLANYSNYFDSAINVSTNVQEKIDNINVKEIAVNLTKYFDDIIALNKDIDSITLYDANEGNLLAHSTKYISSDNVKNSEWFKNANEDPLINIFSRIESKKNQDYSFVLSKHTTYDKGKNEAILKVDFDFTNIVNLIKNSNLGNGGHLTIYDKNYNVVFCSSEYDVSEKSYVKDLVLGTELIKYKDSKYNLFITTLPKTSWKIAIFTDFSKTTNIVNTFLVTIITTGLALTILFIVFMIFLSKQITKPIRLLQLEMSKIENLNYDVLYRKRIKGSKEVEELDNSFNKLLLRVKELAKQLVIEEENKKDSELKALQNQINPHFLYNTLDSIVYLIDSDEKEKASEMIIALSKFFRISISKGKNIIPLKLEVEHVRNYLLIQKIRFGSQFEYTINVDEKLNDYPINKLILQPIVENSIIHGFNELEYVGKIDITGQIENNFIRFDIKDNGYGILPEKIEEIYASFKDNSVQQGVGFKNVYQRLKIYYGDKADIRIESELDCGTDVIILIPYEEDKKYE